MSDPGTVSAAGSEQLLVCVLGFPGTWTVCSTSHLNRIGCSGNRLLINYCLLDPAASVCYVIHSMQMTLCSFDTLVDAALSTIKPIAPKEDRGKKPWQATPLEKKQSQPGVHDI